MAHKIGVLALQGAFARHIAMLERCGAPALEVRYPEQLAACCGLILPGGESTTMTRQIIEMNFLIPLKRFALQAPLFGTCAGMILMARPGLLGLLDITVERNAYGRQSDSFAAPIRLPFSEAPLDAYFIRAPKITRIHSPDVQVLATHGGDPICVQQGDHLASAFHPELTNDCAMHHYFIQLCNKKQSPPLRSPTTPTRSSPTT